MPRKAQGVLYIDRGVHAIPGVQQLNHILKKQDGVPWALVVWASSSTTDQLFSLIRAASRVKFLQIFPL